MLRRMPLDTAPDGPSPARVVHCEDAIAWLERRGPMAGCSMITSLPDYSEFPGKSLDQWKAWFIHAAELVLTRTGDDGVTIFYQTDIKHQGTWVDKGYLVQKAAENVGHALLWHKLVCRAKPGNVTFGRPGYSHLLCFGKSVRIDLARSVTDVLPEAGAVTWTRGMGVEACRLACGFVLSHTATRTVVAPFCGHGTVLAVANACGLDTQGVELSPKRAKKARTLALSHPPTDQVCPQSGRPPRGLASLR